MPRPYTRYPCGIYGPRNLVKRQARKVKRRLLAEAGQPLEDEPPILPPGYEQLFSFYTPALEAGEYTITLKQEVNSTATGDPTLTLPIPGQPAVTQQFEVVAPRFSLPAEAVHGSFPPQGYGALANTLPHVVLADPHLPWARIASNLPAPGCKEYMRNMVPWLALLVFTADELTLTADKLNGDSSLFKNTTPTVTPITQSQTCTVNVAVSDVPKILSTISPITGLKGEPSDDKSTDIIMVPTALFAELFASYDDNGAPVKKTSPDVSRYKYLSHARDINTTGMADAGVEDNGVFGIVVSHRTGPLSNTRPQPVVAHLVSIEGVEANFNGQWPIDPTKFQYVAMSSLYSWNFVTLPEGSFNVATTLQNLGTGVNLLRAPDATINGVDASTPVGVRLKQRLTDGYTMTKYRAPTGELTAAIYRGPFTPTLVPYPLMPGSAQGQAGSTWLSNSGIDLQIMDPEVGIMDVTYAVAWQLGRTLAVADSVFTTALGKLRTTIYESAMNAAKAEILQQQGAYKSREDTVASVAASMPDLLTLHKNLKGLHPPQGSMGDRWQRRQPENLDLSYHGPLIQKSFQRHANAVGERLTLSSDGDGTAKYDEQNTPASTSWMVVLTWVLDKMFLYNIPAQYLIIDPSYLPAESLRFFHVDRNWTDALIDGALSIGNNLLGIDTVRVAIHKMIGEYLYPSPPVTPMPQYPLYGFLMRSEVVTQFPDLKVSVQLKTTTDAAPMLRHENLDVSRGVMICLLDQVPSDAGLQSITFTQPPHQQSFIAAASLDSQQISTWYKHIFTLKDQTPNPATWTSFSWKNPAQPAPAPAPTAGAGQAKSGASSPSDPPHASSVFVWGTNATNPEIRTLIPGAWATDVNGVLNFYSTNPQDPQNPFYYDDVPNAALAGVQLNNPIYRLVVGVQTPSPQGTTPSSEALSIVDFPRSDKSALSPTGSMFPEQKGASGMEGQAVLAYRPKPKIQRNRLSTQRPGPRVGDGFELGRGHGAPMCPPPYSRPGRGAGRGPLFGRPAKPGDALGPAGAPQYTVSIFPSNNNPANPGIPVGTGIPLDLVVSIVQKNPTATAGCADPAAGAAPPTYPLQAFMIVFQLAAGDKTRKDMCLLDNYQGPGPFMLSNLRFNALAQNQYDPDFGECLALRVLPRSTTGAAVPAMCTEMSFMLPVCRVLPHDITKRIPVWITPTYEGFEPTTLEDWTILKFPQK